MDLNPPSQLETCATRLPLYARYHHLNMVVVAKKEIEETVLIDKFTINENPLNAFRRLKGDACWGTTLAIRQSS